MLANFCNLRDRRGNVIYTPSIAGAEAAGCWDEWVDRQVEAGSTHFFFGPSLGGPAYPGVPFDVPDTITDPRKFRALVEKLLDTPGADGKGIRTVAFLGPDVNPWTYVRKYWPRYFDVMRDLQPFMINVPAYEPVPGQWTTFELGEVLRYGYSLSGDEANWFIHLQPGRTSWASNPVEQDDYWRFIKDGKWETDETACWNDPRFRFVKGFLFQCFHGAMLTNGNYNEDSSDSVLDRWQDCIVRIGDPAKWGRKVHVCAAETVAKDFWDRTPGVDEKFARDIATQFQRVARKWNTNAGFGNGIPWPEVHS